jgi:hypothetical protein
MAVGEEVTMRLSVSTFLFALVAAFHTVIPKQAEAGDVGLFRMKRAWWGGTSTANLYPYGPKISENYHPRVNDPYRAPPAEGYVGSTTVNGRPAPRFTVPSKFIINKTFHDACVYPDCPWPGYPASSTQYSYWNLKGSFRPLNSRYGGVSTTTTLMFPTPPTTTPCVGGGHSNCGEWNHDFLAHKKGDEISFVAGNYDFSREGSIMITPGKNRFGGTMHFFYGPNHLYYRSVTAFYPILYKVYDHQVDVRTPNADTEFGDVQYGGAYDWYKFWTDFSYPATTGTPSSPGEQSVIRGRRFSMIAPFTTGMVTVWQPYGYAATAFTLTGYDNRTPNGLGGVISLVHARLVHVYRVFPDENDPMPHPFVHAHGWQMKFHFMAPETANGTVASGGSVSTGDTASSTDPVETTVTVPNGGTVTISEDAVGVPSLATFAFLDQQADITVDPDGSIAEPLVLTFSLFAPGIVPSTVEIFKGDPAVEVADCTDPGGTSAAPDPCVESRTAQGADNTVIVVRTSTASPWNFGALPEPSLLLQLVSGLLGMMVLDKRRRKANR